MLVRMAESGDERAIAMLKEFAASAGVKQPGRDATKERAELEAALKEERIYYRKKQIESCYKECESRLLAASKGKTKKRKRKKTKKKKKKKKSFKQSIVDFFKK